MEDKLAMQTIINKHQKKVGMMWLKFLLNWIHFCIFVFKVPNIFLCPICLCVLLLCIFMSELKIISFALYIISA